MKEIREIMLPLRLSACLPSFHFFLCLPNSGKEHLCLFHPMPLLQPHSKGLPPVSQKSSPRVGFAVSFSFLLLLIKREYLHRALPAPPGREPTSLWSHLQTLLRESSGSLLQLPPLRAAWFTLAHPAKEASDRQIKRDKQT